MCDGVALYVHKSISFRMNGIVKSKVNKIGEIEYLLLKSHSATGSSFVVTVVYRPPLGDSLDDFF